MTSLARGRRVRRVLSVALALNAGVAVAKIVYGRYADSLAIEADGYHSLTDALGSIIALVGASLALRPPCARHPYGYRKLETLAAALIGISLLLLALSIAGDALTHVREGTVHAPRIGIGAFVVLAITLCINLAVASYQSREGRLLQSELLASDAHHTRADCFVTLGVMATALLGYLGWNGLDVPAALAVSVLVGKAGFEIIAKNARYLADAALIDVDRIRRIALSIPKVAGAHTIRTRGTPDAIFMDLRIAVPGTLSVAETTMVARRLTRAIQSELSAVVDVTIHPEPAEEHRYETTAFEADPEG